MRSNDATARGKAGPTRAVKASRSPSDAAGEEEHGPELRGFSESGVDVLFPCASARGRPLSVAQAWRRLAVDKLGRNRPEGRLPGGGARRARPVPGGMGGGCFRTPLRNEIAGTLN